MYFVTIFMRKLRYALANKINIEISFPCKIKVFDVNNPISGGICELIRRVLACISLVFVAK